VVRLLAQVHGRQAPELELALGLSLIRTYVRKIIESADKSKYGKIGLVNSAPPKRLAYQRTGSGTPLVLIHGMGSASTVWKKIIPQLAQRFSVITFDLPGHGKSAFDPNQPMDPHSLALRISHELLAMEVERAHFVGNSLGGWVAMDFAATYPEKTMSFTGLAPAGLWLVPTTKRTILGATSRYLAQCVYPLADQLMKLESVRKFGFTSITPQWKTLSRETMVDAVIAYGGSRGYFPAWDAMLNRRFDKTIAPQIPVTIIFGDSDHTLPMQTSQERSLAPAHARWIILSNTGHAPMWDYPQEIIAEIIKTTEVTS
jgi:pimeloyl-ACP methyl ester carboxylesterase